LRVHLGREHDVVAPPRDRLADDLLRLTPRVDVRGVDEVHAGVERAVHDADALVVVGIAHFPQHHRPEAVLAHPDTGAPEVVHLHEASTRSRLTRSLRPVQRWRSQRDIGGTSPATTASYRSRSMP